MSQQFNDELISAYLDGELTAEEQALVERKLNESPAHQQMLGELSALRDNFQALPAYKLDDQFGLRVLRAAERSMLVGGDTVDSGSAVPSNEPSGHVPPMPLGNVVHEQRGWRLAIGSVGAVAALVLVTLFLANQTPEDTNQFTVSQRDEATPDDNPAEQLYDNQKQGVVVSESELLTRSGEAVSESLAVAPTDTPTADGSVSSSVPAASKGMAGQQMFESDAARVAVAPEAPRPVTSGAVDEFGGGLGGGAPFKQLRRAGGRGGTGSLSMPAPDIVSTGHQLDCEYLMIVEVPSDRFDEQLVEAALRRKQFDEIEPQASMSLAQRRADSPQAASRAMAPYRAELDMKPAEAKADDNDAPGGDYGGSRDILVWATEPEILGVYQTLKEAGLKTEIRSNASAKNDADAELEVRTLARQLSEAPMSEGVSHQDPKLVEPQTSARGRVTLEPAAEQADKLAAGASASPVPTTRAAPGKSPSRADAGAAGPPPRPALAESVAQERSPQTASSAAKLSATNERNRGVDGSSVEGDAAASQADDSRSRAQASREHTETFRSPANSRRFLSAAVGEKVVAEKETAKQLESAISQDKQAAALAKGGNDQSAADAPDASTAGEPFARKAEAKDAPVPIVQARIIIIRVDSLRSSSASEQPAAKD